MTDVEEFIDQLLAELLHRYEVCNDAGATPSSILLAVANAVAAAKNAAQESPSV